MATTMETDLTGILFKLPKEQIRTVRFLYSATASLIFVQLLHLYIAIFFDHPQGPIDQGRRWFNTVAGEEELFLLELLPFLRK